MLQYTLPKFGMSFPDGYCNDELQLNHNRDAGQKWFNFLSNLYDSKTYGKYLEAAYNVVYQILDDDSNDYIPCEEIPEIEKFLKKDETSNTKSD